MRRTLWIAALAVSALALTVPARAEEPIARGRVDFAFSAGGKLLPPGRYEFSRSDSPDRALLIRNRDTGEAVLVLATEHPWDVPRNGAETALVFEGTGGERVLARIDERSGDSLVLSPEPAPQALRADAGARSERVG